MTVALVALSVAITALPAGAAATPASGWQPAEKLNANGVSTGTAYVASMGNGSFLSVWVEFDTTRTYAVSRLYEPVTGWGSPLPIQDSIHDVNELVVASDGLGNAVAVWTEFNGAVYDMWANRYVAGYGWQAAGLIENDDGTGIGYPAVALSATGDIFAAWLRFTTPNLVRSSHFTPGSGWGSETIVSTDTAGDASPPAVSADATGHAVAVWTQSDGTRHNALYSRFVPGTGWSAPAALETSTLAVDPGSESVAVAPGGAAIATWIQTNGTQTNGYAATYGVQSGWSSPSLVETTDEGDIVQMRVGIDAGGNGVAVWFTVSGGFYHAFANRYTAGAGWGVPKRVGDPSEDYSVEARVAMNADGAAIITWIAVNGGYREMWARMLDASGAMTAPKQVNPDHRGDARFQEVAINSVGEAIVGWQQLSAYWDDAWVDRFVPQDTLAPALTLTAPSDGAVATGATVRVVGNTEPGASVDVNGYAAAVSDGGSFSLALPLVAGSNTIVVTATDASGNSATKSVAVTYNDPVPAMAAQVSAANANASAAQGRLAGAEQALDDANVSLEQLRQKDAQLTASEAAASARIEAAASAAGAASLMGLLGVIVGLAGTGIALLSMRKGKEPKVPAKATEGKPSESAEKPG